MTKMIYIIFFIQLICLSRGNQIEIDPCTVVLCGPNRTCNSYRELCSNPRCPLIPRCECIGDCSYGVNTDCSCKPGPCVGVECPDGLTCIPDTLHCYPPPCPSTYRCGILGRSILN
ncbi:uncharacterized protein LOC116175588 [Photinus pyralis]|uniref:uncharacterized protein LOC116175588 n=1 Tax=Photinus pyralis TaxID=7054 RepID=UPI0012673DEB|nr:uncharacterized protein LOC116175588 [Photinus pyralis]